ncbi:hypothetical protein OH799_31385 [Nocardia sp. NBC_00881]|uniref:hypothetical protein n=1 Tax=Nocardia sp. NBC_00881 TaxID=2975995 RepID=UPI00386A241F|nr:hypothetical protein OH799_31385 [Nocardia sp. NBC_00881]
MEMNKMLMPDMHPPGGGYPPAYNFSQATEDFYLKLPTRFHDYWKSFGKGKKTKPPKAPLVPQVRGADQAHFANYAVTVLSLENAFTALYDSSMGLVEKIREADVEGESGKQAINGVIDLVNAAAPTIPPAGMSEDEHILIYITQALEAGEQAMNDATKAQEKISGDIGGDTTELDKVKEELEKLKKENADLQKKLLDPADIPQPPYTPPYEADPANVGQDLFPPGLDGLDDGTGLGDPLSPADLDNSGANGQTPGSLGDLGTDATTPTTPAVQPASAASPMGSGMDMMSSMLPMMMQQAMARNMADQDLNDRRAELDPRRFDDQVAPVVPPVATPAVAQPAAVQPAVTAPAAHHAQPASTGPAGPAGAPGRTPGADGSVVYTFPDGRTQKVSAMVAQALDAAFGNASGTDAQKAYEKTPAKWSDKKQIGDRVDPYQLMTGDVATWDKRSAILVVFGSDEGGTLEAVVNGQLKPFVPEMDDSAGEFGQFAGFAHPKGIELTAPKDGDVPPATPGTPDQSANAAVPIIAAPA